MWQDSEIIEIDEKEFKELYMKKENTVVKLAKYYDVNVSQIIKIAKQLGLSKRSATKILKVKGYED